ITREWSPLMRTISLPSSWANWPTMIFEGSSPDIPAILGFALEESRDLGGDDEGDEKPEGEQVGDRHPFHPITLPRAGPPNRTANAIGSLTHRVTCGRRPGKNLLT